MATLAQINALDAQMSQLTANYSAAREAYRVSISHLTVTTVAEQDALAVDMTNWQVAKSNAQVACWNAAPKPNQTALAAETAAYEAAVYQWTVSTYQPWRANEPGYLASRAQAEAAYRASYPRPLYQQQLAAYATRDACVASWVGSHPDPITAWGTRDLAEYNRLMNAWEDTYYPPYIAQYNALLAQRAAMATAYNDQVTASYNASVAGQTQQPANDTYAAGNAYQPGGSVTVGGSVRLPAGSIPVYAGTGNYGQEAVSYGSDQKMIVGYMIPIAGTGGWVDEKKSTVTYLPAQPYIPPTPAVPAVAGQILYDYNIGWNAGARSIGAILKNGYVEFRGPVSSIDIFAGLAPNTPGTTYSKLPNSFRFSKGYFSVYAAAERITDPERVGPNDVFRIAQFDGATILSAYREYPYGSGEFLTEVFHVVEGVIDAPAHLSVVAYAAGDMIHAAKVVIASGGTVSMLPATSYAADGDYASAKVSFLPMTISAHFAPYSHASMLPADAAGADHAYGEAVVSMLPMTVTADSGWLQTGFAFGDSATAYVLSTGSGQSGGVGQIEQVALPFSSLSTGHRPYRYGHVVMPRLQSAGGISASMVGNGFVQVIERLEMPQDPSMGARNYGEITVETAMFTTFASAYEGNGQAWALDTVLAADPWFVRVDGEAGMFTRTQVNPTFLINTLLSGDVKSALWISDTLGAVPHYVTLMFTTVAVGFAVPTFFGDSETWVMNAITNANSAYENFGFNSYAMIGGEYYGAKEDGIYKLNGADDDGTPITASIDFGNLNFGTSLLKGCTNVYVGGSSDNSLYLKITANGEDYIYRSRSYDETRAVQRFDTGRGLRANYLRFELLSDGADFDMSSIEFLAVPLSRRI